MTFLSLSVRQQVHFSADKKLQFLFFLGNKRKIEIEKNIFICTAEKLLISFLLSKIIHDI